MKGRLPEIEKVYRAEFTEALKDKESRINDLVGLVQNLKEEIKQLELDAVSPIIDNLKTENAGLNEYISSLECKLEYAEDEVYELQDKIESDPMSRLCRHFGITYLSDSAIGVELVIAEIEDRINPRK